MTLFENFQYLKIMSIEGAKSISSRICKILTETWIFHFNLEIVELKNVFSKLSADDCFVLIEFK